MRYIIMVLAMSFFGLCATFACAGELHVRHYNTSWWMFSSKLAADQETVVFYNYETRRNEIYVHGRRMPVESDHKVYYDEIHGDIWVSQTSNGDWVARNYVTSEQFTFSNVPLLFDEYYCVTKGLIAGLYLQQDEIWCFIECGGVERKYLIATEASGFRRKNAMAVFPVQESGEVVVFDARKGGLTMHVMSSGVQSCAVYRNIYSLSDNSDRSGVSLCLRNWGAPIRLSKQELIVAGYRFSCDLGAFTPTGHYVEEEALLPPSNRGNGVSPLISVSRMTFLELESRTSEGGKYKVYEVESGVLVSKHSVEVPGIIVETVGHISVAGHECALLVTDEGHALIDLSNWSALQLEPRNAWMDDSGIAVGMVRTPLVLHFGYGLANTGHLTGVTLLDVPEMVLEYIVWKNEAYACSEEGMWSIDASNGTAKKVSQYYDRRMMLVSREGVYYFKNMWFKLSREGVTAAPELSNYKPVMRNKSGDCTMLYSPVEALTMVVSAQGASYHRIMPPDTESFGRKLYYLESDGVVYGYEYEGGGKHVIAVQSDVFLVGSDIVLTASRNGRSVITAADYGVSSYESQTMVLTIDKYVVLVHKHRVLSIVYRDR